jgi:hypothetical protein
LAGFLMPKICAMHAKSTSPQNAMEINAFSRRVIACWRVHVT